MHHWGKNKRFCACTLLSKFPSVWAIKQSCKQHFVQIWDYLLVSWKNKFWLGSTFLCSWLWLYTLNKCKLSIWFILFHDFNHFSFVSLNSLNMFLTLSAVLGTIIALYIFSLDYPNFQPAVSFRIVCEFIVPDFSIIKSF